jgi:LPS-assembly protein
MIELNHGVAKTSNGFFELFRVPVMYLPYATHPVDVERESGILLPYIGTTRPKGSLLGRGFI